MSSERLSLVSLSARSTESIDARVSGPRVDPAALSLGIVHFGIGAFHRSHQAVFTEDAAAATGDTRWGILGVTGRSGTVVRQLRPQDCLYTVLQKDASNTSLRVIGSVREVACPAQDSLRVVRVLADEHTHIATLTVTEKGYLRAVDGAVDLALPGVLDDIAVVRSELLGEKPIQASSTAIGLLIRGLAARYRLSGRPLTVLSCDNVMHNGAMVKKVILSFAGALGGSEEGGFVRWLNEHVTYPSSMVDRITPAVAPADRTEALDLLGLVDEALVVAEPFSQWVIEDNFADSRPAWEHAGALMTADVLPFERAQLRILNATHSLLAYLGCLSGYETIAEAVADDTLCERARLMLDDDVIPTLRSSPGFDLAEYRDTVLRRFANPALAHTTLQVAMDGSQKLPERIFGTVLDRLAMGALPLGLAFAVAAWIAFVASTLKTNGPVLNDPLADRLVAAAGSADAVEVEPEAVVDRFFGIREIFPRALAESEEFRNAVTSELDDVRRLTTARRTLMP
ncbi:MAG: mannitol dehydrogenase family protein [Terrimesophilobacter sp.]